MDRRFLPLIGLSCFLSGCVAHISGTVDSSFEVLSLRSGEVPPCVADRDEPSRGVGSGKGRAPVFHASSGANVPVRNFRLPGKPPETAEGEA